MGQSCDPACRALHQCTPAGAVTGRLPGSRAGPLSSAEPERPGGITALGSGGQSSSWLVTPRPEDSLCRGAQAYPSPIPPPTHMHTRVHTHTRTHMHTHTHTRARTRTQTLTHWHLACLALSPPCLCLLLAHLAHLAEGTAWVGVQVSPQPYKPSWPCLLPCCLSCTWRLWPGFLIPTGSPDHCHPLPCPPLLIHSPAVSERREEGATEGATWAAVPSVTSPALWGHP